MSGDRKRLVARHSYGTPLKNVQLGSKTRHSLASSSVIEAAPFTKNTKSSNNRQSIAKGEETNISVYVRCRSRSEREIKENSGVVVSTMGHLGKEVLLQTGPKSVSNKTYTFDRVFGAESDQEMVYEGIAKSVLQEMLQGYNCTIFAYGQTGTGKTYTMSGDIFSSTGRLSEEAGIIPRILKDLFENLHSNSEYSVKVSFIELYNEELKDLLVVNDQEERKVRIFEEPNKKSILVQGMEEVYIKNVDEGMKILKDGSYKRQVAATQCNDLSSRSHSVFTITVHIKEIDPVSGEEYLKIGKLNLVDLAGSENINRSGAENKRAREAGMINQSLLTLGRVINALVDQSSHIPYRESKLTRLLQDSLGGKTKTCIIATISPAKVSLDETISTLEYANRAKSIKNKPQVNQTMSKKLLIKEYVQEIERLRNDLNATRNKNGIYLAEENWSQVTAESESRRIQVEEQKLRLSVLEEQIKKFKGDFDSYLSQIKRLENSLKTKEDMNEKLEQDLKEKSSKISQISRELDIEKLVNKDHENIEIASQHSYKTLVELTSNVISNKNQLFKYIDQEKVLQSKNTECLRQSKTQLVSNVQSVRDHVESFYHDKEKLDRRLNEKFDKSIMSQKESISNRSQLLESSSQLIEKTIEQSLYKFLTFISSSGSKINDIEKVKQEVKSDIITSLGDINQDNLKFIADVKTDVKDLQSLSEKCFEDIDSTIVSTIDTISSQLQSQAEEIQTLKRNIVNHQTKYDFLLQQQVSELIELNKDEIIESKRDFEDVIEKISSIISESNTKRSQRLQDRVQTIYPQLQGIIRKNEKFSKEIETFIDQNWYTNQISFIRGLQNQGVTIKKLISDTKNNLFEKSISAIDKKFTIHNDKEHEAFHNVIEKLDENMNRLDIVSNNLKELNKENKSFTHSQLDDLKRNTKLVISDISHEFNTISEDLSKIKPEIIDSFTASSNKSLKNFNTRFHDSINTLYSNISDVNLDFENSGVLPERKQIESFPSLPTAKSRQDIIDSLKDQDFEMTEQTALEKTPTSKTLKRSTPIEKTPIPVPDKRFKVGSRPLSDAAIDTNRLKIKDKQAVTSTEQDENKIIL